MKQGKLFGILVLSLLIVVSVATDAMGQGRGRRVSRGFDKKCAKFVNCNDARDGRWDGRGPNRGSGFENTFRRHRNRNWDRDGDSDNRRWRRRHRDRDFDRDWRWRRNR